MQVRTELCLLNYARGVKGLGPLNVAPALVRSAQMKAEDIVRCNQFAHDACGFDVRQRFADSGYFGGEVTTRFGENLAWGGAEAGGARCASGLARLADVPREPLQAGVDGAGLALVYVERFRGVASSRIWVSHFGHQG